MATLEIEQKDVDKIIENIVREEVYTAFGYTRGASGGWQVSTDRLLRIVKAAVKDLITEEIRKEAERVIAEITPDLLAQKIAFYFTEKINGTYQGEGNEYN